VVVEEMQTKLEHLTESAARKLADRIEAFWKAQGYSVRCELYSIANPYGGTAWALRSNLVNGLPRSNVSRDAA
jgi:hypothetical protein